MTDDEIWADDKLDRRADAEQLATFLRNRSEELEAAVNRRSYVLNIDESWGNGKTFFLVRFRQLLCNQGHVAVYVNAWRDDFAEDPLIAVMAAIDDEIKLRAPKNSSADEAWSKASTAGGKVLRIVVKGLATRLAGAAITVGAAEALGELLTAVRNESASSQREGSPEEEAGNAVGSEVQTAIQSMLAANTKDALKEFRDTRASIENFTEELRRALDFLSGDHAVPKPMFVLVDELDRCRPLYAISTLERIKHLFNIPSVVFVMATDTEQLLHSISTVYGSEFEGRKYLKRFFDRTYSFEKRQDDNSKIFDFLFSEEPIEFSKTSAPLGDDAKEFIQDFFDSYRGDIRSVKQIYDLLRTFVTSWNEVVEIELVVALPLIEVFHHRNRLFSNTQQLKDIDFFERIDAEWAITTTDESEGVSRFDRKSLEIKVSEIFKTLWKYGGDNIGSLINSNLPRRNGVDYWIRTRLSNEFQKRHGGIFNSGRKYDSLIASYPGRIRQATRLRR